MMPCYSSVYWTLLLVLICSPGALADDWEDFTNNLATDLAPLLTLFGERLTKQFLSESISLLDNFIFALSPIGVLTAVVSVIRVRGSPSLKAFVGRAQEGPAEAESELLSCVSESTAELFNDGGISRVFGRPKILEIFTWRSEDGNTGRVSTEMGTLYQALASEGWHEKDTKFSIQGLWDHPIRTEMDMPNLSLNKGIKRRGDVWFYCAAIIGAALQIGVIIYAAITVFLFPQSFQVNGKAVDSYAFPFYVVGTVFLSVGMLYCAAIIERSSKEYYFQPKGPSKIYWLQPGNQHVGDQVFNAFIAESTMTTDMKYIKSTRVQTHDGGQVEIYTTLLITMLGFILQFVGERGLHSSVILAQLGATFVMSVLRACLRTERMSSDEDKLSKQERELISFKQQELDAFTFHLRNIESFSLVSVISPDIPNRESVPSVCPIVAELIQTRRQLADLTESAGSDLIVPWGDIPIRKAAHSLAKAMMTTMDLLSGWGYEIEKLKPQLTFEYKLTSPKTTDNPQGTYCVDLMKRYNSNRWRVDPHELEAIVGLWTWSLYKEDKSWRRPLNRLVGLSKTESTSEETFRYFHKWIYRVFGLRKCPASQIDVSQRLFGFESDEWTSSTQHPTDPAITVVKTSNELERMVAQDIYIQFLSQALANISDLSGDIHVVSHSNNSWLIQHSRIDALAQCFEESGLGFKEDAMLCIVPILKQLGLLPELGAHSSSVRERTTELVANGDWNAAFSLVRWFCVRTSGSEFEQSMYELGFLCRRALLDNNTLVRSKGFEETCDILKSDIQLGLYVDKQQARGPTWPRTQGELDWWHMYCTQLGWIVWNISLNVPGMQWMQPALTSYNIREDLPGTAGSTHCEEDTQKAIQACKDWLTLNNLGFDRSDYGNDDELAFEWALQNSHHAVLYWLITRWLEISEHVPTLVQHAWSLAAKNRVDWVIDMLRRYNTDIDTLDPDGRSALIEQIVPGNLEGARILLANGANPNGSNKAPGLRPLITAAYEGYDEIVSLLIDHGANVDIPDAMGLSAVQWASKNNRLNTVRLLLAHDADVNVTEGSEMSMIHSAVTDDRASMSDRVKMIDLLLENGCNINAINGFGHTALMLSVMNSATPIMRLLLSKGAKADLRNQQGFTALEMARNCAHDEGVRILMEAYQNRASD